MNRKGIYRMGCDDGTILDAILAGVAVHYGSYGLATFFILTVLLDAITEIALRVGPRAEPTDRSVGSDEPAAAPPPPPPAEKRARGNPS